MKIKFKLTLFKIEFILYNCGPDSSVGIATDYGLDGPGSSPGGGEIFAPVRTGSGGPPGLL